MEMKKTMSGNGSTNIQLANKENLNDLVQIYKDAFETHNIFQKSEEEILIYLESAHEKNKLSGGGFLVAIVEDKAVGGILLKKTSEDLNGKHTVWKYNHLAVSENYQKQGFGGSLVKSAENMILDAINNKLFNTAKIEIGVVDTKKLVVDFYKKYDFEIEGELKSHYRFGETVYILGKEIK